MGYRVVDPTDIEPAPDRPSGMRYVSEAVGMETTGPRLYEVAPGEEIPLSGLHCHDEQEEAFYVVEGELRVETPEQEHVVERGEFFVAEPKSPHRAFNGADAEENARVVAVGAPPLSDGHPYER